jgi:hypothetical protein
MKNQCFWCAARPSTPAADLPLHSRLRGVLIFEQNGALASTPCAFRFQAALEPIQSCNDTVHTSFKRFFFFSPNHPVPRHGQNWSEKSMTRGRKNKNSDTDERKNDKS